MSRLFKKFSSSNETDTTTAVDTTTTAHKEGDDVETLNESKRTIISHLLKQIKFGEPIKHLCLPCFVLQPRSMLESFTDTFNCLDELFKIQEIENEEKRFLQMLKFSLTAWHTRPKGIKKPFNPVIGELFDCYWDRNNNNVKSNSSSIGEDTNINGNGNGQACDDDKSYFVSEQISHHPSHSAFCFYNKRQGVVVNGNVTPTYVKFYGNFAESSLKGLLVFHFLKTGDIYEMTLPVLGVRGIVLGKLQPFMDGKATLRSTNGNYQANLEYLTNSLLSSSKNHNGIKGNVTHLGKSIYKIKGHWDKEVIITAESSHHHSGSSESVLMDVRALKKYPIHTYPIDQQPPNSSDHLWKIVMESIVNNNDKATAEEKQIIEQKQRDEEQYRRDNNIKWVPERFILRPYNKDFQDIYVYKELENLFPQYFTSRPNS